MPTTLQKARKHIAKKRNGHDLALHEFSRDSKRLHKASVRDQKLGKLAASRNKKEQVMLDRAAFFQKALQEKGSVALELATVQEIIHQYVHQHDEEYSEAKKARRPGRPASAKEDMLKMKIAALEEEYRVGFYLPDLTTEANVRLLDRWEGQWAYLTSVSWVKITSEGSVKKSSFPPTGSS
ncbi:Translation machinery-associated protein 16 [Colletotrichum chlorophyti]|uniref:Translation machinery-associated protein 16 n=1 Tax=Colletotrichum chlorophyti TaxID=708187 RepID=A0A1Q8S440_9PEZI|nr:Translation machinery-associated protein 16 [Colletotrichum chlorophyti]